MCEPPSVRAHRPEADARSCRVLSIIDKPPAPPGVSPSVNLARTLRAPKIPFAEFAPSIPHCEVWPSCAPLRCGTTAAGEHKARQTQRGPQRAAPPPSVLLPSLRHSARSQAPVWSNHPARGHFPRGRTGRDTHFVSNARPTCPIARRKASSANRRGRFSERAIAPSRTDLTKRQKTSGLLLDPGEHRADLLARLLNLVLVDLLTLLEEPLVAVVAVVPAQSCRPGCAPESASWPRGSRR